MRRNPGGCILFDLFSSFSSIFIFSLRIEKSKNEEAASRVGFISLKDYHVVKYVIEYQY